MGIANYLSSHEKGEHLNDTLIHKIMEAYVSLGKQITTSDGIVDTEKLKDDATRQKATKGLYKILEEFAVEHYGASTADPDRKESLVFGLFGMNPQTVLKYFEQAQEKSNFSEFFNYAQRQTPFGYFLNQNSTEKPKSKLSVADAEETVTHTKTKGAVDPKKLTVDSIAELLNEFVTSGVISPQFLKNKDYAVKE